MKKNVAGQVVGAQMVNASTGAAFAGSVTVYVTVDGGTQAAGSVGSGACTSEGNGFYTYAPAQAETNGDHLAFTFIGTGAVPATVQIYTSTPQTGDAYARLGAPVGASISADIAGVQADTDNIQTRIPAALVSGRMECSVGAMASDVLTAAALASDAGTEIGNAVWASGTRVLTAGTNIVLAKGTGVTGFNDLSAAAVNSEVDTALADVGLTTVVTGRIDATVSSRLAAASYTAPDNATIAAIAGFVDTEVAAIKAKTDNLPADPADASDIAASFAAVNATLATMSGYIDTEVAAIKTTTDRLATTLEAAGGSPGEFRFTVDALVNAPAGSGGGGGPTAAQIADAVWDEAITGHLTAGSTGAALNAAGSSGDPWSTPLPGAYGAGTAGNIVGNALDTTVSSRASQMSADIIDDLLDTEVGAIKAKTDQLAFSSGLLHVDLRAIATAPVAVDTGTAGTVSFVSGEYVATSGGVVSANVVQVDGENVASDGAGRIRVDTQEVADAVLNRDFADVNDTNDRTLLQAARHIRNRWDTTSHPGYVTVRKEDDTTEAWRAQLSTDGSAQPITGSDPT